MKRSTFTEQYFLLTMNRKGKINSLDTRSRVCLVMAALLDLQEADLIELHKKEIQLKQRFLPEELTFLKSVAERLSAYKRPTLDNVANTYAAAALDREINQLMTDIRIELIQKGVVHADSIHENSSAYLVDERVIEGLVAALSQQLFFPNDQRLLILLFLLQKTGQLKHYFTAGERKQAKQMLQLLKNSNEAKQTQRMLDQIDRMYMAVYALTVL
ncbi:hypothetical protein NRIC_37830 [Enterococcus florum]|uniref:Uncharacterized protein n=1 Tax=Enterococcus florum TaxID=2480627 RepID=A0A4P5PJY6_9ENTE|nr:GPP34 family phosphoprotein [Enterococcus florum]GCF95892.1 hypothetical protein NRIC_37830 [Enterococcus florum]